MNRLNFIFLTSALVVTSLLMWGFGIFQGHFSKAVEYSFQVRELENKIAQEKKKQDVLIYQLEDMKQNFAQILTEKEKQNFVQSKSKNWGVSLRSPASQIDMSGVYFEKLKKTFKSGDFEKAIKLSDEILTKYPLTVYVAEVYFFKAESYYLKRDFKNAIDVIDQMISLFPESELTGFIMLRMGQISEINNRTEEALEIYKTARDNFKSDAVQKQAALLMQSIEKE